MKLARACLGLGLLAALGLAPASAQVPAADPAPPWYLERGTAPRPAAPEDEVPPVAAMLAGLMKDGSVPGFYDGQFKSVDDRFDELAALASDPDVHHIMRIMAVMALQEAGSGEPVARVLKPLLIKPWDEFGAEQEEALGNGADDDPDKVRAHLEADLSLHARFALAKDGQTEAVMEKIEVLEQSVHNKMFALLDPSRSSERDWGVRFGREIIFSIGYHYQQFDDYVHASEWFHKLCDNLPGHVDTCWAYYNLACIAALTGHSDDAIEDLRSAYAVGFTDSSWMAQDGDLTSVRDRPDFKALLSAMRNEPEQKAPRQRSLNTAPDRRNARPQPPAPGGKSP